MSFLFNRPRQPSSAEKIAAAEMEVDMMTDMFARLAKSCNAKCIDKDFRESELNKAESVCLDRCVAKFFDVNVKVSEKMQNDAQSAGRSPAAGGGGLFGM
ncbi:putative mitochondrial intermembrane space translocase subunit Tim10 [Lineolata rhizophorae]|uniref:Mitochondrial import inner membrane translocase subunit n=1 Tax=Lineolata rhizophorae TaxID=578093 RepID=A0A6A6NSQ9_9PEZI|nr:putative mitochondrial intermembrane space translocase subunit Tim10 [Lineolata rhizophorae]